MHLLQGLSSPISISYKRSTWKLSLGLQLADHLPHVRCALWHAKQARLAFFRRGREGSLALLLVGWLLPLLAWALGDFSSVEARSIFSSAMMPDSSCSGPGSGEGDASSASGDILTFPQFGYTSHTAPGIPGAQARSALVCDPRRLLLYDAAGRWLSIRANPRLWNRTTSLHDRNA